MRTGNELDELRAIVGVDHALAGDDAAELLVDFRQILHGTALAAVRPADTAEVAAVVRWCAEHGVAVVTQGGNTGLSGGATPVVDRPAIVLSTRRLNEIEDVDVAGWTMTVQAGTTIEAMQEAAAARDRKFAPDWGARGTATIGGAIATNAGGLNVLRYGTMREQVMGLEVVLGDGRVWDGLRALRKDATGYDLTQLIVGSEGTLGIVTRAIVRLHAATPYEQTALATLAGLDLLMPLYSLVRERGADELTAFELMPTAGVERVCERFGIEPPLDPAGAEFVVLIKLASTRPVDELLARCLADAAGHEFVADAVVASTPEQEARLWTIRDELSPTTLYPQQSVAVKLDAAVPIDRIETLHRRVEAIAAEVAPDALVYDFGHVGDGNVHLYVLPADGDAVDDFAAIRPELTRRIDEVVVELGGTLSAEHGIGRALLDRIGPQKPPVEWELMRAVKAALDPDDVLNPGALLPPS
ncbi:MAG: FAD-binding oxidoreductase [Ilumatobacter sp.]|nr:FAD-binding oxidoreductase [Ilumatobacter sp.]